MALITQQELIDAAEDAQILEKVISDPADQSNPGHPDGTVTTRLGETYYNVQASLKAITDFSAALQWTFDDSTVIADPTAGKALLDDADVSLVTQLAVSGTDLAANDVSGFVETWDDSTNANKGTLVIRAYSGAFAIYAVTSVTDNTGWYTVNVEYLAGSGSFVDEERLYIGFARSGDTLADVQWRFDDDTSMADPGSGDFRFNDATIASVTAVAVSDLDYLGNDVSGYLNSWGDSTSAVKGTLIFRSTSAFAAFNITSITDNTGWSQVGVTYLSGVGSFSDGGQISVSFSRSGDSGGITPGGDNTFTGSNSFNGEFVLNGSQSETLTATTNNLALDATANRLEVDLTGDQTLNGLTGGSDGRIVVVRNVDTSETLTLAHDDAGSTAANRFALPSDQAFSVLPGHSVAMQYSSSRWRLIAQTFSTGTDEGDLVQVGYGSELPALGASNLTGVPYPPGFHYNVTVKLAADTDHDITFGQFSLRNDANDANVDASSSLTKQIDATFAEGDNQGGMASGQSIPTSGTMYAFAVTKDADGTVDVMYDTSDTGANVNAGWTAQRRIATIDIDASDNIIMVWDLDTAIIYPNDGSAASPANVSTSYREPMDNPFTGSFVNCTAQVLYDGSWGAANWAALVGSGGTGITAIQLDDDIVVQSGSYRILFSNGYMQGHPFGTITAQTSLPCRVIVEKTKGAS